MQVETEDDRSPSPCMSASCVSIWVLWTIHPALRLRRDPDPTRAETRPAGGRDPAGDLGL